MIRLSLWVYIVRYDFIFRGSAHICACAEQELMVEPLVADDYTTADGDDHAEIELPAAGLILGNASIFLQVTLKLGPFSHLRVSRRARAEECGFGLDERDNRYCFPLPSFAESFPPTQQSPLGLTCRAGEGTITRGAYKGPLCDDLAEQHGASLIPVK